MTLLQFLQQAKESQIAPFFPNNTAALFFMQSVNAFGLIAFEKLPEDTQRGLIATYHSIYII